MNTMTIMLQAYARFAIVRSAQRAFGTKTGKALRIAQQRPPEQETMTDQCDVFLSYSHIDLDAAALLRAEIARHGLSVFKDDEGIRAGDLWLARLQEAVESCGSFVVLVGSEGVRRWIGAETQAALNRHFGVHDDTRRLPIFPILLGDTQVEMLPSFLRLFQATRWNGTAPLPEPLLQQMRARTLTANDALGFEGCPYVGLAAYQMKQAHLFFGRHKDTLDALACFDTRRGQRAVRWLEIHGNSGSGKSSLMNAGVLPLVDQGWLWPRTGYAHCRRIGPLMPGAKPVDMLAEHLARTFGGEMGEVLAHLSAGDHALAHWLRSRKQPETAFLLAIDQFEELFSFAEPQQRSRFDQLLAAALQDADCPLFVISTVRADFLDRFDLLPRLARARAQSGELWPLPPMGADALREVIAGPAQLARLDVSEVQEAMVAEARDEPGALPLIENALQWLWETKTEARLSGRLFTDQGGLAGILSRNADDLLDRLGGERERALALLFRLVNVDPDGRRHTRRRIALAEAVAVAGGGERGLALVNRLAGERTRDGPGVRGPLRLITVTDEATDESLPEHNGGPAAEAATTQAAPASESRRQSDGRRWVNLIHETLIRSRGRDAAGRPQPFWPTLWHYIERNKEWATRRERLQLQAREWQGRKGAGRLAGLAGWSGVLAFRRLAGPGSIEQRYMRWSLVAACAQLALLLAVLGIFGESALWADRNRLPPSYALYKPLWTVGSLFGYTLKPEVVNIKPGSFTMGCLQGRDDVEGAECRDDDAAHDVTITRPFALGKYEVTFLEYDYSVWDRQRQGERIEFPNDYGWGRFERPVIGVSWDDAKAYVKWLSEKTGVPYRLPTEAEWEYAARAGTGTGYWWGTKFAKDRANCQGDRTSPAGSLPAANPWGLHDMAGNVYEWVEDWHAAYARETTTNPHGPRTGQYRVLRGGAWFDHARNCRAAYRSFILPGYRDYDFGFRVSRSPPSNNWALRR